MKHTNTLKSIAVICCTFLFFSCSGNDENKKQQDAAKAEEQPQVAYIFSNEKMLPVTSVKNQSKSGTCWSFSTISFLESELLRQGKGEYDLSEIVPAYYSYINKAVKRFRRHGNSAAGEGGQAHDVLDVIRSYGITPQSAYSGMLAGDTIHNHNKLQAAVSEFLKTTLSKGVIPENWLDEYKKILDEHIGAPPQSFEYEGKTYTPREFADALINPDDYVEITSYKCYPFYEKVLLEIPDNWSNDLYYNLPIDELMQVIDYSLESGYTVLWDGDVSEKGFSHKNCIAIAPIEEVDNLFSEIREEYDVDDDLRQKTFDSHETTDDHLMHLVGTSTDQNGKKYYIIKNSFGIHRNGCGGFVNMSIPYARLKVVVIMVNKKAIPHDIAKKLKIE